MHVATAEPSTLSRLLHRSVGLILLAILSQIAGLAQTQPQERRWDELNEILRGRRILLALPDGAVVQGDVAAVREDSLVLNVYRTTNAIMHPKGRASIPRASVTLIELETPRRNRRRSLGATVGAIAGVALGAVAARSTDSFGSAAITFAAVGSGGALMGYFIGKSFDNRRTRIRVIP